MRHKYATQGIVLARSSTSEASSFITILTPDLGIVRAKAQGVRKPGAKLAPALQTLGESDVSLIRGREGWRLAGAISSRNWFNELERDARTRAGRVAQLLVRLVPGQMHEPALHTIFTGFLEVLSERKPELHDAAECLAALRTLKVLGLDPDEVPGGEEYDESVLEDITENRPAVIARINRGIAASGL